MPYIVTQIPFFLISLIFLLIAMTQYSKVFGPTDSAADTKTTVGAAAELRPGACTIKELWVGKSNVVNAKECAGFITVEAPGLDGPHHYALGNGCGGTTNGGPGIPAEKIDVSIPIKAGAAVTISVTDAEVALGVSVEVGFNMGSGINVYSYVLGGAGIDPAKDTLLALVDKLTGLTVKMGKAGRIKEIRYCAGNIIDAKEMQATIAFVLPVIKGPWEYVFGSGASGATLGGQAPTDVRDVDIPVKSGEAIIVNITANDALDSATLSFQVV